MKVVYCAYDRPNYVGGPNAGLRRLLPDLRARGVDARAWFLTFGDEREWSTIPALERLGVPCRHAPYHPYTEERVRWLISQLKDDPPDVFVPNLMPAAYFAARWARKAGAATVAMLRSPDPFHMGIVDEFLFGRPEYAVSAVVSVSEYLRDLVAHKHPGLAHNVAIPSSVTLPERRAQAPGDSLVLVYTGRLVHEAKQVTRVAAAFCRAAREVPGVEGVLYGDGPARADVERVLNQEGNGLLVLLSGRVDSDQMQDAILKGHVIVLLSAFEGLPVSLMEGMACGLVPVCLPTASGIPELVEDGVTGILLKNDQDDFVRAIRKLRENDDLWQKLSTGARDRIATGYTRETGTERWIKLFEDLPHDRFPRGPVRMPLRLDLTPVHPGLAREDTRAGRLRSAWIAVRSFFPLKKAKTPHTAFVTPRCTPGNIDLFVVRQAILKALCRALPFFSGTLVDVGAGRAPYRDLIISEGKIECYLTLDLAGNPYCRPDIVWDGHRMPLANGAVQSVLCTEVLEHCPTPERMLGEAARILGPGGTLFLTVPFLWPLHDVPHDEFRFTPWSLRRLLTKAGFGNLKMGALGGYEAALAQMIGLFVRRRSRNKVYRRILSPLLSVFAVPLVFTLTRLDRPPEAFIEGQMITGLWVLARKEMAP